MRHPTPSAPRARRALSSRPGFSWPALLPLLALGFAAGAAQAQVYGEVALGSGKTSKLCQGLSPCDDTDVALRLTLGYALSDELGVEASLMRLPKVKAGDDRLGLRATPQGLGVGARYKILLTDKVSANLRAGLALNQLKQERWATGTAGTSQRERKVQPYLGAGLNYALTQTYSVGVGLDVTRAKLGEATSTIGTFSAVLRAEF